MRLLMASIKTIANGQKDVVTMNYHNNYLTNDGGSCATVYKNRIYNNTIFRYVD